MALLMGLAFAILVILGNLRYRSLKYFVFVSSLSSISIVSPLSTFPLSEDNLLNM